jgi:uncharacterized protein
LLKYLLLLVIAAIVWRVWQKNHASRAEAPPAERPPERMVACTRCGVLMPESDCLADRGSYYCCEAHRQAAEADSK